MPQKLSAINYIKNNVRRVVVLTVSLGLSFVLVYLTQFMLSTTEESFKRIVFQNTRKMQVMSFAGKTTLGIDADNMGDEEFIAAYIEKNRAVVEELKKNEGVKDAWYGKVIYCLITAAVGQMTYEMPLVEKEKIPEILKHFEAELIGGRLPEQPGEVVLDTYFGCGIPYKDWAAGGMVVVLSEGIEDMAEVLAGFGVNVKENFDTVVDMKWGKKFLQEEVVDVIANSTQLIYMGIIILLLISLTVVYTTYLRDRHNEWCLYCSIGYSRGNIYCAVMRELLFTFGSAFILGGVISILAAILLKNFMLVPQGLQCKLFYPKTIVDIFCTWVFLLGILQIPVRYALYRIRTVDAIEDDLY